MSECWFKPKRYGYGATPVTWQGWALMAAGAAVIAVAAFLMSVMGDSPFVWIVGMLVIGICAVWTLIAHSKTEGEWRWRWGHE
jgi:hypothetical protein